MLSKWLLRVRIARCWKKEKEIFEYIFLSSGVVFAGTLLRGGVFGIYGCRAPQGLHDAGGSEVIFHEWKINFGLEIEIQELVGGRGGEYSYTRGRRRTGPS